jgi:hypothetical protein
MPPREKPDLSALALLVLCVCLFFAPLFPALVGAALALALPILAAVHTHGQLHAREPLSAHAPYDERRA